MLDNSGKITKNYKLMGTESDPVIIAQRLLNLYRQLHIFSPEKKDAYNKMLMEQPIEVKRILGTLPGGIVLQQYLSDIEKEAGISDENFDQINKEQEKDNSQTYSATSQSQEQPKVVVQSAASPEMVKEIAKAFKEALVTSDKNRKEDTKELAQTLMTLQSKLTQAILEKQNKNTTQSQSELIQTITHTQTQEFSAIISQALKEIRQMSNDALIEAIQKVHAENMDFFKNQIFSTVSPMPMSTHYDAKMQEFQEKYAQEADDAVSLDEYTETPSPVTETAIDDISEDEYYQEMAKHEEDISEQQENDKEQAEEIDESLLEGFDGTPEDLFESDNEWKVEEEKTTEENQEITDETAKKEDTDLQQAEMKDIEPVSENTEQKKTEEEVTDKTEEDNTSATEDENIESVKQPENIEEKKQTSEETIEQSSSSETDSENEEEYEWEYVEEDEGEAEAEDSGNSKPSPLTPIDSSTVQATYNLLESVDEENTGDEEYEWEYVEEDEDENYPSVSEDSDEEYEWEYVEDDGTEDLSEEYNYDNDPYNPNRNNPQNYVSINQSETPQSQNNDNIILDDNFGILSNDDN